jgi:hypothetical protein
MPTIEAIQLLGVSEKTLLFSFYYPEIAAIFDTPSLLKCIFNLFLIHNVANVECEITVNVERLTDTAQWDGILRLYEVEKRNLYRLLPTVTERHIQHGSHNTIKVSLAAQIMNSTVAPAINTLVTVGKNNSTVSLNDTLPYQ